MRAGEPMEEALRECARNIRIGKILIQKDKRGERKVCLFVFMFVCVAVCAYVGDCGCAVCGSVGVCMLVCVLRCICGIARAQLHFVCVWAGWRIGGQVRVCVSVSQLVIHFNHTGHASRTSRRTPHKFTHPHEKYTGLLCQVPRGYGRAIRHFDGPSSRYGQALCTVSGTCVIMCAMCACVWLRGRGGGAGLVMCFCDEPAPWYARACARLWNHV